MVLDLSEVTGIGEYTAKIEATAKFGDSPDAGSVKTRTIYYRGKRAFLVANPSTVELRCDDKLGKLLTEKYESVMQSRYFGAGGIEIVLAGNQLSSDELYDLIRLSYNLSE